MPRLRWSESSSGSSKCCHPLDEPERRHGADRIGRRQKCGTPHPWRILQQLRASNHADHRCDEHQLSDFHPDVEEQQGQWNIPGRQRQTRQCPGKAKSVQEPECERHHPGALCGQAGQAPVYPDDLTGEEQYAERDCRLDRRSGHVDKPKRRQRQRDRVRRGKSRYCQEERGICCNVLVTRSMARNPSIVFGEF